MHLLLVNISEQVRLPQGLLYVASAVHSHGHRVTIHDETLSSGPESSLQQILASRADIVGIHIVDTGPPCLDEQYFYPPLTFQLVNCDAYLKYHDQGVGILQYITSRGCHGRRSFCSMASLCFRLFSRIRG